MRQLIFDEIITIAYVKSCNNLADPFIKELSRDMIKNIYAGLELKIFH